MNDDERFLAKQVNGFDTRNNFIRSMDIARAPDLEAALANYEKAWFGSRRKQYVNEAFKHLSEKKKPLFWSPKAIYDMLDEIALSLGDPEADFGYDMKKFAQDLDRLKSKLTIWSSRRASQPLTREDIQKEIRSFEAKYRYPCPDTFKTCWMNTGAYIALSYDVKYGGLVLPGCRGMKESLALLGKLRLEIIGDMDHDVDRRLFEVCWHIYSGR